MPNTRSADATAEAAPLTVLVYSDDVTTREKVRLALGPYPAADLPRVEYLDVATRVAVLDRLRRGGVDLAVLDGEAVPAGGMGICREIRDEIYQAPPVLVLVARPQDHWLAAWARADGVVSRPLDPRVLADAAAELLRRRLAPAAGADVVLRG